MIEAPVSRRSSGVSALTVAFVPTGMNCGVSTVPCGSVSSPTRARVDPSVGGGVVASYRSAGEMKGAVTPRPSPAAEPTHQVEHDRQDQAHHEHRPQREVDPDGIGLDSDVAGQATDEREVGCQDEDHAEEAQDDATEQEQATNALEAVHLGVARRPIVPEADRFG